MLLRQTVLRLEETELCFSSEPDILVRNASVRGKLSRPTTIYETTR